MEYGIDIIVPGMVYAATAVPPVRDARPGQLDRSDITKRTGLGETLNLGDVVAVTVDSHWTALQTIQNLSIKWQGGQTDLPSASLRAQFDDDLLSADIKTMDQAGDTAAHLALTDTLRAEYAVPYLAHAMMEPMNYRVR